MSSKTYPKADFIYIGYPKAASTFVSRFLDQHPQVTTDRNLLGPLYEATIADVAAATGDKPDAAKIHVSINEKVAESICVVGDRYAWRDYKFVPDSWDSVKAAIVIDPHEAALRLKRAHPAAKVLMMIRDQVDWLHSSYKFFMPRLPAGQRSFSDFCATPRGMAYIQAGHFDRTIDAYAGAFGPDNLLVLRYEDIGMAPQRFMATLCSYLGIAEQPMPSARENEGSTARVAAVRRFLPQVDRLPPSVKAMAKNALALLPESRGTILSGGDIRMTRSLYASSNARTEKLLSQLKAGRA